MGVGFFASVIDRIAIRDDLRLFRGYCCLGEASFAQVNSSAKERKHNKMHTVPRSIESCPYCVNEAVALPNERDAEMNTVPFEIRQ